jgi:serine/threonine-protein kinase CHEK2
MTIRLIEQHERGIVHRDIKPENILLADTNLTIKVADFGLAKIIGEESFTTTLCGTPSYVAPEILQPSNRRRYTRAVDIWSLGVVLYICLCGFPPFSDELYTVENPYTLAQQIMHGRYDFPSPYWDSVGDPALDLIEKMLTVDPEQRITVDECLEHPWLTGNDMGPASESILSDDGLLAGRMTKLDFAKRRPVRERTLLSTLNEIHVSKIVDTPPVKRGGKKKQGVKVYAKNEKLGGASQTVPQAVTGAVRDAAAKAGKEAGGSGVRFLATGQNGDVQLFAEDESSRYSGSTIR